MKNFGSPSREASFNMAADLFKQNGGKLIVETGCFWLEPQGCSTLHLAELAASVGGQFHSVDNNPEHVVIASKTIAHIPKAFVYCSESLAWLGNLPNDVRIDLLYLDSFDRDDNNPRIGSIHSVAELGACLGKMAEHSLILLDDWDFGNGENAKPCLSRELLLYRGWKLVFEGYQLLFSR